MIRGEAWWIDFPGLGRRPGVVLTRDTAIPLLPNILVAPTTRTIREIPSEVALDVDDGLPHRCVVSLDNLSVVSKRALRRRITALPGPKLDEICRALRFAVTC